MPFTYRDLKIYKDTYKDFFSQKEIYSYNLDQTFRLK